MRDQSTCVHMEPSLQIIVERKSIVRVQTDPNVCAYMGNVTVNALTRIKKQSFQMLHVWKRGKCAQTKEQAPWLSSRMVCDKETVSPAVPQTMREQKEHP